MERDGVHNRDLIDDQVQPRSKRKGTCTRFSFFFLKFFQTRQSISARNVERSRRECRKRTGTEERRAWPSQCTHIDCRQPSFSLPLPRASNWISDLLARHVRTRAHGHRVNGGRMNRIIVDLENRRKLGEHRKEFEKLPRDFWIFHAREELNEKCLDRVWIVAKNIILTAFDLHFLRIYLFLSQNFIDDYRFLIYFIKYLSLNVLLGIPVSF